LKNQNKRKKETKKYRKTKIRLSKVTNTQKKGCKKKKHKQMRLITKFVRRKRRQRNYVLFENLHP
jgi:hypothetical protein